MSKLKTNLKHWDKYLFPLVDKKINCLDIGAYTGENTCWMLTNLCTNPYSKVFSIDKWKSCDDCSEYKEYTDKIEKKFDKNVEETGEKDKNVKINMTSSKAIIKLKDTGLIIFDFIFIDASHQAKDVLSDAILSWDILNENGILIFDDYEWDNVKGEIFKPKEAIDTFIKLFNLQLKVLHVGYQYILKKINQRDYSKPKLNNYYNLLDEINFYKSKNIEDVILDQDTIDDLDFKINIQKYKFKDYDIPDVNKNFSNYVFLQEIYDYGYIKQYKLFELLIKKYIKNISFKQFLISSNIDKNTFILNRITDINLINKYIDNNGLLNYYLNNTSSQSKYNKIIKSKIKKKIDINNEYIINFNIYNKMIKDQTKYDLIYFGIFDNTILRTVNSIDNIGILYFIGIALNKQNYNGNLIITTEFYKDINLICNCIYILKKYYKKVIIKNKVGLNIGISFYIIATNFIGINDDDKNKINLLIKEVYEKIDNDKTLTILKQTNNKNYLNIYNKLNNFVKIKKSDAENCIKFYKNIYDFISKDIDKSIIDNIRLSLFRVLINKLIYNYFN